MSVPFRAVEFRVMQFRNSLEQCSSEQISAVRYSSVHFRAVQFIDDAGVSCVGNQSAGQGRDGVGTVLCSVLCVQCAAYSVLCSEFSFECAVCTLKCIAMLGVLCKVIFVNTQLCTGQVRPIVTDTACANTTCLQNPPICHFNL